LGDISGEDVLYSEALALFEQAVPTDGLRAIAKRAVALSRLGHWRRAIGDAQTLESSGKSEVARQLIRASLAGALHHGGPTAAIAAARTAENLVGKTDATAAFSAAAHAALGHRERTVELLAEAEAEPLRDPSPDLAALVAFAQLSTGDAKGAASRMRSALSNHEGSPTAYVLWARAAAEGGDAAEAVTALRTLPENGGVLAQVVELAVNLLERQMPRHTAVTFDAASEAVFVEEPSIGSLDSDASWNLGPLAVSRPIERTVTRLVTH
jgi:hypothetical protein